MVKGEASSEFYRVLTNRLKCDRFLIIKSFITYYFIITIQKVSLLYLQLHQVEISIENDTLCFVFVCWLFCGLFALYDPFSIGLRHV